MRFKELKVADDTGAHRLPLRPSYLVVTTQKSGFVLNNRSKQIKMRAIAFDGYGGPQVLALREVEKPVVNDDEVLIKVAATAVNGIDILQRKGVFKMPNTKNKSWILGLECSGVIVSIGKSVTQWKYGDQVCALLDDGGYAELVVVSERQIISAPKHIPIVSSAALPCAASLVWGAFFGTNKLAGGETVLIHGAAGGVGSLAIQVAKYHKCRVFATAGTKEKVEFCKALGADICINHKEEDFAKRVRDDTNGTGVNYILDHGQYDNFHGNIQCLTSRGKLIYLGLKEDSSPFKLNADSLEGKQIAILGLRVFSMVKSVRHQVLKGVEKDIWPAIERLEIKPRIYKTLTLAEAAEAHILVEKHRNLGKILLIP